MAIQLKSKPKPKAKATGSKQTKRTASRASKAPANKSTAKKGSATKSSTQTRRSPKTDMSQSQLNKILKPLARAAKKRDALREEWKEAVAETSELIVEASNAGVPVVLIVSEEHGNISRQHYYHLMEDAAGGKRSNGHGSKATAKKAISKKKSSKAVAKPKASAKPGSGKRGSAKKSGKAKRKIRTKA